MKTKKWTQDLDRFPEDGYKPYRNPSDEKKHIAQQAAEEVKQYLHEAVNPIKPFMNPRQVFGEDCFPPVNFYEWDIPGLKEKNLNQSDTLKLKFNTFEKLTYNFRLFQRTEIEVDNKSPETFEMTGFGNLFLVSRKGMFCNLSCCINEGNIFELGRAGIPHYSKLEPRVLFEGMSLRTDGSFSGKGNTVNAPLNYLSYLFLLPKTFPVTGEARKEHERVGFNMLHAGRSLLFSGFRESGIKRKYLSGEDVIYRLSDKIDLNLPEEKGFPVNDGKAHHQLECESEFNRSKGYFQKSRYRMNTLFGNSASAGHLEGKSAHLLKSRVSCLVDYDLDRAE
jgi:hypothetical protein